MISTGTSPTPTFNLVHAAPLLRYLGETFPT
jgi:hypothetical protein